MDDLAFYRLPKTTITSNIPLTAMVQLGQPASTYRAPSVTLDLEPLSGQPGDFERRWRFSEIEGRRYALDVPGEALPPGAYAVSLAVGDHIHDVDEVLWVMSPEDYRRSIREDALEPFLETTSIPASEVPRFVQRLIHTGLAEDRFDLDIGRPVSALEAVGSASPTQLFPDSPIRWAVDNLVDAFRYIGCPGIASDQWLIIMHDREVGIYADGTFASHSFRDLRSRIFEAAWYDLTAIGVPHGDPPPGTIVLGDGDENFVVKVARPVATQFTVSVVCRLERD